MNITEFFTLLGAKLNNQRTSWGGVTSNGTLILKAGTIDFAGNRLWVANTQPKGHGDVERTKQILQAITEQHPVYAVKCKVERNSKGEEVVTQFDKRELLRIENIILVDDCYYGTVTGKVPAMQVRSRA